MADGHAPLAFGIGLDAGGTATRWAVVNPGANICAEGQTMGGAGLMLLSAGGQHTLRTTLAEIVTTIHAAIQNEAQKIAPQVSGFPCGLCAGFTGLGDQSNSLLQDLLGAAFRIPSAQVTLMIDIEMWWRCAFPDTPGYLIYAGTGSISAYIDDTGVLHRAGGRGVGLDDGDGAYWIAREALRHIWRAEDASPGTWQHSPMARSVFAAVGGSAWSHTRAFFYSRERGAVGALARAIASVADDDPVVLQILRAAGDELSRLGRALIQRFGNRPIAYGGGVFKLHPVVAIQLNSGLPTQCSPTVVNTAPQLDAARWALRALRRH